MRKNIIAGWTVGFFLLGLANIVNATLIDVGKDLTYDSTNNIVWLSDRSIFNGSSGFFESLDIMSDQRNSGTFRKQIKIDDTVFKLSWRTALDSEMRSLDFRQATTREAFTPDHVGPGYLPGHSYEVYYIRGSFAEPDKYEPGFVPWYSMEAWINLQDPRLVILNPWDLDYDVSLQDASWAGAGRLFAVADLQPVPEPATILLMGLCLPVLIGIRRWRYCS